MFTCEHQASYLLILLLVKIRLLSVFLQSPDLRDRVLATVQDGDHDVPSYVMCLYYENEEDGGDLGEGKLSFNLLHRCFFVLFFTNFGFPQSCVLLLFYSLSLGSVSALVTPSIRQPRLQSGSLNSSTAQSPSSPSLPPVSSLLCGYLSKQPPTPFTNGEQCSAPCSRPPHLILHLVF